MVVGAAWRMRRPSLVLLLLLGGMILLQVGDLVTALTAATPPPSPDAVSASVSSSTPDHTAIIPIFPLRQRGLLEPGETLVLNLYEERYIRLAEQFLRLDNNNNRNDRTPRWIGAVPANTKPQILPRGGGPIVPLLDPGDVGVICSVEEATELFHQRRTIRLRCVAQRRIGLTEICSDGTATVTSSSVSSPDDDNNNTDLLLPYITARYRLLASSSSSPPSSSSTKNPSQVAVVEDDARKVGWWWWWWRRRQQPPRPEEEEEED
jgi:hypothetical protein